MIYRADESSYEDLRVILFEVFKLMNMFNSDCLNDTFKFEDGNYSFRTTRKL